MPLNIPTVQQLVQTAITAFEAELNQTVPSFVQAFVRVTSTVIATLAAGHYKYAVDRAAQSFVKTASGPGLDVWGELYGLPRKQATAARLRTEQTATAGLTVDVNDGYIGDANGIRYFPDQLYTADVTNTLTVDLTCEETGVEGNLSVNDTLTMEFSIAGISPNATVIEVLELGTDVETDEAYRQRILDEQQTVGGGSNQADYRGWAQETPGVVRAYPYSGSPISGFTDPTPNERTVFVEADTTLSPDGIPTQALLDLTREYITYDPSDGTTRQAMSCTDDTLFVEPITRTGFYVEITGLSIDSAVEVEAKAAIETDVDSYFRRISPFVDGLDPPVERNDTITALTISSIVQKILEEYGASASGVAFGLQVGTSIPYYILSQGETSKLADVNYV